MPNEVTTEEFIPIMPYPNCIYCGYQLSLNLRDYGHYTGPITCFGCKGKFHIEYGDDPKSMTVRMQGRGEGGVLLSPPRPIGDPALLLGLSAPTIPVALYRDFEEAARCLEFDVPRGAAVLCRHAIQQALLLKDIRDDRPIEQMVNIAHQQGILSEAAHRQCRAAVFLGTKAAHPQELWTDQIGAREARAALELTQRVLLELFSESGGKNDN